MRADSLETVVWKMLFPISDYQSRQFFESHGKTGFFREKQFGLPNFISHKKMI